MYCAFYVPHAKIISAFHEASPGIQVQLCDGYSTELLEDELTAWLPAAHPMAKLPVFPVKTHAKEPYIETYPEKDIDNTRVFARCGITPNLKFSTMDSLATYSMVEAGLNVSMNNAINGRAWSGNVRILPLDPPQIVEIGIAALPELSPAVQRLFQFLKLNRSAFRADLDGAEGSIPGC